MNIGQLEGMNLPDLRVMSRDLEIQGAARMKKDDLILKIMQADDERRVPKLLLGALPEGGADRHDQLALRRLDAGLRR